MADVYTNCLNKNEHNKVATLNTLMLKVHGFDYVKENVRSRTYISVAQKLKDVHFGINNFYAEPGVIQKLADLGSAIPSLALKESVTAILYVKLGNSYGVSWDAERIADKLLDRLSNNDWVTYVDNYLIEEQDLLDSIKECTFMRNQWKKVIKKYKLNELGVMSPVAKKIVSIHLV